MTDGQPPKDGPNGANVGMAILSTLIAGIGVWGFIGWLIDRWLDTKFALPIGLILGMVLAVYSVIKRYGM